MISLNSVLSFTILFSTISAHSIMIDEQFHLRINECDHYVHAIGNSKDLPILLMLSRGQGFAISPLIHKL